MSDTIIDSVGWVEARKFAFRAAADYYLTEVGYRIQDNSDSDREHGAYDMAIEILAALCHIDAEPAKAELDRLITEWVNNEWNEALQLPHARGCRRASFDEVEAAGLDPTGRFAP